MGYHEAAYRCMGHHHPALGETDTDVLHTNQVGYNEVDTGVGKGGIADGRTDALKGLSMQLLHGKVFIGRITPVVLPHLLVHSLCGSLSQSVGQCLGHPRYRSLRHDQR